MTKKSLILGTSTLAIVATASLAAAEVNQPVEIILRPQTTPGGQITVGGDLGLGFDPTAIGLGISGAYGVSDQLEVGVGYGLALEPFEAKGDLGVEVAYNIMEGDLSVAAQASFGYSLLAEGISPLGLGARVRFRLGDNMAIFSPGNQIIAFLDGDVKPIFLQLPVGFAFQVNPNVYAFAGTNLAVIGLSDADGVEGYIFADFIPLALGAFFSPSNTMDLGASLDLGDLKADEMDLAVILHARLHM